MSILYCPEMVGLAHLCDGKRLRESTSFVFSHGGRCYKEQKLYRYAKQYPSYVRHRRPFSSYPAEQRDDLDDIYKTYVQLEFQKYVPMQVE